LDRSRIQSHGRNENPSVPQSTSIYRECEMAKKLTNEIIDERLIGRFIKRLENFVKTAIPIKWQCVKELKDGTMCNHIWKAKPDSVIRHKNKTGCPKCSKNLRLTNEEVDERLKRNNIPLKRLEDVVSGSIPIKWKCENCDKILKQTPINILHFQNKCYCQLKMVPITNEIIDSKLKELQKSIMRKSDFIKSNVDIIWECKICDYEWAARSQSILIDGTGCPRCTDHIPLTNEEIDLRLITNKRKVKRFGDVINSQVKLEWNCTINPEHFWEATPNNVLNNESGCPKCRISKNAEIIENAITIRKFIYDREFSFPDCRDCLPLPFDFVIFDNLQNIKCLIEYDGEQHFSNRYWKQFGLPEEKCEEEFKKLLYHDKIKNEYCKNNGLKLIRISYKEILNVNEILNVIS
jgi:hypothetical protein